MPESVLDDLCGSLDSAPTPIVLVDESGRLAFVNARAEQVFGYGRAELVGGPAEVLLPEWALVERAIRTVPLPNGPQGNPADGPQQQTERCWVRVTFTGRAGEPAQPDPESATVPAGPGQATPPPRSDRTVVPGARAGETVVQTDALYRHRHGHSLQGATALSLIQAVAAGDPGAAADRFQALFETTTAGMVEVTHDHRITAANAAFCLMTGYTAAELSGATFSEVLFPEDRAGTRVLFDELAAGTRSADEADRRYRRKDGSALWVRVSARARHEGGRPPGVSAVLIDLTDRKHLEERLQRAQNVSSVGLRASYLAHDFNNLLTVISGCAGVLLDGIPEGAPARDLVREMAAACQRGAGLTSQLLALGRTAPAEPRVFDLNEAVAGALKLLRHLLGRGIALVDNLAEGLPRVKADPTQMEQAILNLAINAKDAMPDGGVLTVETRAVRVSAEDLSAYPGLPPGEYVQLAVCDTGLGMPDEVQARAFEPFFTTKDAGKGTGLGLAAVQAAVTQAGGRACVYSESGLGTVFELVLPAASTPALPPAHGLELVPRCAGTVLLVERDDTKRRLTRLVLRAHGFEVLEASDRAEGLELAQHHTGTIALVLTGADVQALAGVLRTGDPSVRDLPRTRNANGAAPLIQTTFAPVSTVHRARAALGGTL